MAGVCGRLTLVTVVALSGCLALACVESGEIAVRNASDRTILTQVEMGDCQDAPLMDAPYEAVTPEHEVKLFVASGAWLGDACLTVFFAGGPGVKAGVEHGRVYEVVAGERLPLVRDAGEHDEPWYFEMQRWEWSWTSWQLWLYVVPFLLGAPFGLFITLRFFYRYYALKQEP